MGEIGKCPLCDRAGETTPQGQPPPGVAEAGAVQNPAKIRHNYDTGFLAVDCPTCGRFEIHENLIEDGVLANKDVRARRYLLSALTSGAKGGFVVDQKLIERLRSGQIVDKTVSEKIELVVRWYADHSRAIGASLTMFPDYYYPHGWCRSGLEWLSLVKQIAREFAFFDRGEVQSGSVVVTLKGWQWLAERPKAVGDVGFIAMAFDPSLSDLQSAIEQGIR
jgi:hypothetical protein